MKVVKINAVWCSGCLVMNKVWKNILSKYNIETINLDYDMDEEEVKKYDVGDILPVLIFYKNNKEVCRIIGEKKEEEIVKIIEEVNVD